MMDKFRNDPPETINNSKSVRIKDYLLRKDKDLVKDEEKEKKEIIEHDLTSCGISDY